MSENNIPQRLKGEELQERLKDLMKKLDKHNKYIYENGIVEDTDDTHYAFESLMEAVYGDDYFDWYNKQYKED